MDVLKFLNAAEGLEISLARLYRKFSDGFGGGDLSDLFTKLSLDEDSHQEIVRFEIKMVMRNRAEFKEVDLDVSGLPELTARIDEAIKSETPLTPEQAVRLAIDCEQSAAEVHFRKAVTVSNPGIAGLMKSLGVVDKGHYERLFKAADKLGIAHGAAPMEIEVPKIPKASAKPRR